jgi:hypothetical protein
LRALVKAKAKEWNVPVDMARFVLVKRAKRRFDNVYDFQVENFLKNNGGNGNGSKNIRLSENC